MSLTRRGFLRGSALAAAAVAGSAAIPFSASAQEPATGPGPGHEQKDEQKKDEGADGSETGKDGEQPKEEDPFKATKKDEQGRDYRTCPQAASTCTSRIAPGCARTAATHT